MVNKLTALEVLQSSRSTRSIDNRSVGSRAFMVAAETDDVSLHLSEAGSLSGIQANDIDFSSTEATDRIAQGERKFLNCLRFGLFTVFLTAAILLSLLVFLYTKHENTINFAVEYESYVRDLVTSLYRISRLKLWAAHVIGASFTSQYLASGSVVATLPDLHPRTLGASYIARAQTIAFAPILLESQRSSWEAIIRDQKGISIDSLNTTFLVDGESAFAPILQIAPSQTTEANIDSFQQGDLFSIEYLRNDFQQVIEKRQPVLSRFAQNGAMWSPTSALLFPVFDSFNTTERFIAMMSINFEWKSFFDGASGESFHGLVTVVRNTCGGEFTFQTNGQVDVGDTHNSNFDAQVFTCSFSLDDIAKRVITETEFYSPEFDEGDELFDAICNTEPENPRTTTEGSCEYELKIYPSADIKARNKSRIPEIFAGIVVLIFLFTAAIFFAYDFLVEKRQRITLSQATRSNAILHSLFPAVVRDRVFESSDDPQGGWRRNRRRSSGDTTRKTGTQAKKFLPETPKLRLKTFLSDSPYYSQLDGEFDSEPIAEMFPDTTIMFADIAGFTAWASEREPTQVFVLLETLYRAFDSVAARLGVFKVETIGDCYVAVTGLPDPNEHHAVIMTWFAYECLRQMKELTKNLEVSLGPGTSDLSLRVGLHSGPVTAGVLRGEKSRFQLFGDTMNTTARMESTGEPNLIHSSQETADLLVAAGKVTWVTPRDDVVFAKGKGDMQTFWLKPRRGSARGGLSSTYLMGETSSISSSTIDSRPRRCGATKTNTPIPKIPKAKQDSKAINSSIAQPNSHVDTKRWGTLSLGESFHSAASQKRQSQKRSRLVDWNVDLLLGFLAKIVAGRGKDAHQPLNAPAFNKTEHYNPGTEQNTSILEEVTEIIILPEYDEMKAGERSEVILPPEVREQLHEYVTRIASMYRENPFHGLEHASHVTMSAVKLMRRIISPVDTTKGGDSSYEKNLHELTFGISSDALTQFCVVFAALIHDVDHAGVSNAQLVQEQAEVVHKFGEKSTAEQNSVYIAWEMLMEPRYSVLRSCIYCTEEGKQRFRQLMVNSVMATDIMDKELQGVRRNRWDKAFNHQEDNEMPSLQGLSSYDRSRKATSVIEHIIQASDVAHTMQHWHIFRKWNERLFDELYIAYKLGRTQKDPSDGWYEGQLGFFDNYIIPLAKKLKDCGVFGVAGDEYLTYAVENRKEWALKGREESEAMLIGANVRYGGSWSDHASSDEETSSSPRFV